MVQNVNKTSQLLLALTLQQLLYKLLLPRQTLVFIFFQRFQDKQNTEKLESTNSRVLKPLPEKITQCSNGETVNVK